VDEGCQTFLAKLSNPDRLESMKGRKMRNMRMIAGSGGGTRTPDTRIMIPLL
jgi:hypothetical protein